eukprot:GGOE01000433.1.p1 GENE.GGOE01000433.1~~GGOE01000433.1.p1  ORF type:complete len:762 (+),score=223.90 GGOE01000433.1:47-2287(+)
MGNAPRCCLGAMPLCAPQRPKGKKEGPGAQGADREDLSMGDVVACGASLGMALAASGGQPHSWTSLTLVAINVGSTLAFTTKRKVGRKRLVVLGTTGGLVGGRMILLYSPPMVATWSIRSVVLAVPALMALQAVFPYLTEQYESSLAHGMFDGSTTTLSQQKAILLRILRWGNEDALVWGAAYLLLVVNASSSALLPLAFSHLIQSITQSEARIWRPMARLSASVLVVALINAAQAILFTEASTRLQMRVQKEMMANVMQQDVAFFEATAPGELLQQLSTTGAVAGVLQGLFPTFLRSVVSTATTFSVLVGYDARLALICIVGVPFDVVASYAYSKFFEKYNEKVQAVNARSSSIVLETIGSIKTVRLFAAEKEQLGRFWDSVEELIRLRRANNLVLAGAGIVDVLLPHLTTCVLFLYTSKLVREGAISVSSLMTVSMYQSSLTKAFEGILSVYVNWSSTLGTTKRIFEILDRVPRQLGRGDYAPACVEGSIRLRNVTFVYDGAKQPTLTNFSLAIQPGEKVALVGPSGGGKSTIVNLILGLRDPTEGTVCLDGVPIHEYAPKFLFTSALAVVSQDPVLFSQTFAQNISLGLHATPEEIETAAKRARAHDFIMQTKDGYGTKVGARGEQLSGGQRQRVAMARALVRSPAVLLLDEATSALDGESEALVQEAVGELMMGRTVVVVAHRLSTVQRADRIIVIANGAIAEEGTHAELLKANGVYRQMVLWQLRGSVEEPSVPDALSHSG